MRNGLSITVIGLSFTVLFAVTYVLAVIFCLVASGLQPHDYDCEARRRANSRVQVTFI